MQPRETVAWVLLVVVLLSSYRGAFEDIRQLVGQDVILTSQKQERAVTRISQNNDDDTEFTQTSSSEDIDLKIENWNGTSSVRNSVSSSTSSMQEDLEMEDTAMNVSIIDQQSKDKQVFVFHVGPMKTGSTTIQLGMKSPFFKDALERAGWVSLIQGKIHQSCFLQPCDGDSKKWNETFFDLLPSPHNTSVFVSTESLCGVDSSRKDIMEALSRISYNWELRIVVVHREFASWLPSLYAQKCKGAIFKSRSGRFKPLKKACKKGGRSFPTFLDWLESEIISPLINNERLTHPDSLATYKKYESLLNNDRSRLIVVDLVDEADPSPFLRRFVSKTMPELHSTFKRDPHDNKSSQFIKHFAGEEIFAAACQGGHIPVDVDHLWLRNLIIKRISHISDLPHKCVNQEQIDLLWNRSVASHELFSSLHPTQNKNITMLRQRFDKSLSKMCSVDGEAVLKLPEWANFSAFVKEEIAKKNRRR